ncbi:mediator of RNA polymerase II transcription subunit 23 isoform X1 [Eutrema salsugineum]|uniref:mediator of RNA polymerase II transcription subunit 23 isoform X1 n=1 Tax=Eutrema salsugineum TaxID=72664 RepID=UPI000CED0D7D|nr:mediator of RNA polymerase II transcription subunit 23 isoform X1 [Eutrema salsugineum]
MDQSQRTVAAPSSSRSYQFHPARAAIIDLFNLYLGRGNRQKPDESIRDPPNKSQKRVHAPNRDLPPRNEQFILDFEQLQSQFGDPDQLRTITESVLISMVLQCSNHAPRAEFLLFALRTLCRISYINWDTFLPSLLSSVSAAEASLSQVAQAATAGSSATSSQSLAPVASNTIPSTLLPSAHGIGSSSPSGNEPGNVQQVARAGQRVRAAAINSLRQLSCKIILIGIEFNLKPVTHAEIFQYMMNWLVNWDRRDLGTEDSAGKSWRSAKTLAEWLRSCLDVIWLLVEEGKSRIPFYELLRSGLQFIENIPDDEALFTLIMEIHRRRDAMAMHMLMLDQHLHCPTFGTHRISSQSTANVSVEAVAHLRYSPITYPSVLGEPLCGEDLAMSIPKGSLDWERAVRCIRHAIRTTPSPDWWKRVLVVAPCYRPSAQAGPIPGAVFTSDMICEAIIDRIVELLNLTNSDANCWQEWLVFSDIFFFLIKSGCTDFVDFIDKLVLRLNGVDKHILRTNHVTWLLAQIIRVELVMTALNADAKKVETTRKILSFHREDRTDPNNPQSVLLDFVSSCQNLRIWSLSATTRAFLNNEQLLKGKQIDEWWKSKGERMMDYMNMDDRSIGMFWVVSYTMAQPACETVINWLSSAGMAEMPGLQPNDRVMMMQEVTPLPMSLLSGFSMNLCLKLALQMEEALFVSQVVPSIAMVETYTRLLLISPHSMFRSHFSQLAQRNASLLSKPGVTLLVLEILNYRLLPLYRYQGKSKTLMYDVTKIISALKGKRGDHRIFRLAENLCMNLILSLRDFFSVKREGKGPTEFTETLNRVTIMTLAITIKTRGIADADHLVYLQTMLEQILATSQHTWSERTLRHFPTLLRETLIRRVDKRSLSIQAWQQAETTVINQCTQLLSPSAEPAYVMTYLSHSFPQHRQYLCAGACLLMQGHPDNINSANLARVLREVSPEEVTANIYTLVDVLLHHVRKDLQQGHNLKEVLAKQDANLAFFFWTHEMLPLDIFLLALIDRDDDPHALIIAKSLLVNEALLQRIKGYCSNRGPPEHWLNTQLFNRNELQKALGNHLSWKDRYPTFFDDIAARLLPVIPLVVYRLIENSAFELADIILSAYAKFLAYHPLRFTFVRDILAYFYGHLPGNLVVGVLKVLDLSKIPLSESFPQYITSSSAPTCPPLDYFATLLLNLVNNVIPPLSSNCSSRSGSMADFLNSSVRPPHGKTPGASQPGPANASEGHKAFYQIQDPGTYTQLVLETAVIEILSLPVSASDIVSSLVKIIVNIQSTLIQSGNNGFHGAANGVGQGSVLPTSPSGGSTDSMSASRSTCGINTASFVSRSGYTCQQLSCLLIQACGLLLAQLPPDFHTQLYIEASRVAIDTWWLNDGKRSEGELDSAVGYALMDPTWAAQDNTSTAIGNIVALLHAFFSNLPQEWLEGTHIIIRNLRPVTSVAMLRVAFRIMGPLLPRLANTRTLFNKTLALLLSTMVDVFGKNSQTPVPVEASQIADLIDFLHHIVHYEGQGGAVQSSSKPRPDILALIGRAADSLRPDVQHLFSHLKTDPNSSIYAAAHQNTAKTSTS